MTVFFFLLKYRHQITVKFQANKKFDRPTFSQIISEEHLDPRIYFSTLMTKEKILTVSFCCRVEKYRLFIIKNILKRKDNEKNKIFVHLDTVFKIPFICHIPGPAIVCPPFLNWVEIGIKI